MAKSPLRVKPVKNIYRANYPSYLDKNPIYFPETKPYPFSHKLIKWVSTSGLASALIFGSSDLSAQAHQDSLYNPFTLERSQVPYTPVSFGTGAPTRLRSNEAIEAIRRAFKDSGIELERNVWLDKDVGVRLDGYSHQRNIGFVFMDHTNMDQSFIKRPKQGRMARAMDAQQKIKRAFKEDLRHIHENVDRSFQEFLNDKEQFVEGWSFYNRGNEDWDCLEELKDLKGTQSEKEQFIKLFFQFEEKKRNRNYEIEKLDQKIQDFLKHIDVRLDDPFEKLVLLRYTLNISKGRTAHEQYKQRLVREMLEFSNLKSNQDFIDSFDMLMQFYLYNNGSYYLSQDLDYLDLKLEIANAYPVKSWMKRTKRLDQYFDSNFLSFKEFQKIIKNNEKGKQFIAPISHRDGLMIVGGNFYDVPLELYEKQKSIYQEFSNKNGMTKEVLDKKRAERQAINMQYTWKQLKDLPKLESDSIRQVQRKNLKNIEEKYKAMELLSEEEKDVYYAKLKDVEEEIRAAQKKSAEQAKENTMRRLENEVKRYIRWAQAQMGG